eukprot:Em0009g160a
MQWCPEHYQLQKELARGLACSVQAVDATPSRKGAVGSASEANAEADAASISVNPAVKADLAESITVTRATSSSVPYLGPTFATEIKVLNDKEQLLQQRLVELQNKMGDLTKTITKKKNTVTTLRHQLELIRSQLEVEDTTLQDQIQQQEELLEKQDTLSREYHSVLMQKQELLFPGGSPLVRVKRKRSPSISPGISPPSSPTQSKKLRITPSLDQPNWQPEECPASGLTVAQFPAKKDGSPAGTGAGSEGMRTAMEHRAITPKDIPDGLGATPKGKLMEQEGRQNENLARNAGCDTGPAKPGDKPAEQNLVEQSPLLPNTGCVGSNGHVPSKPKDNLVPTVQPATLLLRIKEEKPNSPSTTHDAERAVVPSPEAREQGGGGRVGPVVSFTRHSASVLSLKMSGNKLFTCSSDKSVRVYNVQTGQILNSFTNHQKSVTCLELYDSTSGTSYLLSGSVDKTICMYNIETGVVNAQFKCGSRVMYMCVQRSLLFVGLSSAVVIAIDLEPFVHVVNFERLLYYRYGSIIFCRRRSQWARRSVTTGVKTEENPSISCLCANDDYLFTAAFDYKDGLLSKFADPKFDSIPQVHVLSTFTNTVLCMKIHENHLYCGSADSSLQVHRTKTWEREHHITCHSGAVSGIQVLGKVLITACFDKYIRCFDLEKMELVQVYGGNTDMVFTVCVSKKMVYTGLKDGAVKACPIDLTVYYQCQWNKCKLRFGFSDHLSEHMKDHLGLPDDLSVQKCQWENCTQTLSTSAMLSHLHNHCAGVPSTKL